MNWWPFRKQPKKPKWTIRVHGDAQVNVQTAAAWTVYGGTKALVRMGDYFKLHPEARGHTSPFDEEVYARDALAEHWAVQTPAFQASDRYLYLLVRLREAGLMREYVWSYLRDSTWPEPEGLRLRAFEAWAAEHGLTDHEPRTLASITPG
jgi:hypothetical protein